jgi:hypothetical protein
MPKTDQRASVRPIAFVLHDTVRGDAPDIFQLAIRPEDLARSEPSNMAVVQTLGGAWADISGAGLATCTISGHTGWGAGNLPDGFEHFLQLHETVFERFHQLRAEVAAEGKDPDGIKLIFSDGLDEFAWVVAPQVFDLRRNRARPLLSQYRIAMVKLADDVVLQAESKRNLGAAKSSLDRSIDKINQFAANLKGGVATALGPLKAGVGGVLALTASGLDSVRKLTAAGHNVVHSALEPVMEITQDLTKVSTNVMGIAASIKGLPLSVKRDILEVKSALNNAHCLLSNAIKGPDMLPDYTSLYGASNCSSTSFGRPASEFADTNVFPQLFPASASPVTMSAQAESAVASLAAVDVLAPPPMVDVAGMLNAIAGGASISSDAVDKAIAGAAQTKIMGASVAYV